MAAFLGALTAPCTAWTTEPGQAEATGEEPRERKYRLNAMDGSGEVTIEDFRGEWVALHFLLKTECPFCLMHTRSYVLGADAHPGVRHLFIKPDEKAAIERWTAALEDEAAGAPAGFQAPVIYRDPYGSLARHLLISHGYEYNGEIMRYPAFVLIDPDGNEVYRHVGQNTGDRFGFERFDDLMESIDSPFRPEAFNLMQNSQVALGGHDPVAYFEEEAAVPGDPDRTGEYHGILLRFASEENRARFAAEPARYVPAYGGWCAMGMTTGEMREVDYSNFRIQDGRLYLFARGTLTNARSVWQRNPDANRAKADAHWKHLSGQGMDP